MNNFKNYLVILIIGLIAVNLVQAASNESSVTNNYNFQQIWQLLQQKAPALRQAKYEQAAAQQAYKQSTYHWFPKLQAQAKSLLSNDPLNNFLFTLEQRSINNSDFNPTSLNSPSSNRWQQYTLALNFALYEGGAKVAVVDQNKYLYEARSLELLANRLAEYCQTLDNLTEIAIGQEIASSLTEVDDKILGVLKRYQLGSTQNLLGRSGLLALQNLKNKISELRLENQTQIINAKSLIAKKVQALPQDWQLSTKDFRVLLEEALPQQPSTIKNTQAFASNELVVELQRKYVEASAKSEVLAQSYLLPHLSLFAQTDWYQGERNTANSYSAGAWLQWQFFNAENFGGINQAKQKTLAAEAALDQTILNQQQQRQSLVENLKANESILKLIADSNELLNQQVTVSFKLFQSGAFNAVQLSEVMAKKIELIMNKKMQELNYAKTRIKLFQTTATTETSL